MIALLCALAIAQVEDSPLPAAKYEDFSPYQDNLPVERPADAIILFDGENHQFVSKGGGPIDWPIQDGNLVSSTGGNHSNHIVSKVHFRDADIHAEFMLPGSGSGNSGVYIHGNYELQILRSSKEGKELTDGDVGSLYGFAKPLVNAGRSPNEWQVYDIRYCAPRRNAAGEIVEQGSITAWLNGQKVQDATRFGEPRSKYHPYRHGTTDYLQAIWKRQKRTMAGPLFLQDHGHPVRFRNVWIKPLDEEAIEYQATTEE